MFNRELTALVRDLLTGSCIKKEKKFPTTAGFALGECGFQPETSRTQSKALLSLSYQTFHHFVHRKFLSSFYQFWLKSNPNSKSNSKSATTTNLTQTLILTLEENENKCAYEYSLFIILVYSTKNFLVKL